jgi:CRISPR-associated protein Csx10
MTKTIIHVQIQQQEPLLLGDASGTGMYQETADYVPGSVLRGAVAERLLASCTNRSYLSDHRSCPDRAECPFWQIFGGDTAPEPLFGNGYPAQIGPAYPFPATARTCKRCPGFTNPRATEKCAEHHEVFDTLVQQFVYELISDPQFPYREHLLLGLDHQWARSLETYEPRCPQCDAGVVPAQEYYAVPRGEPGYAESPWLGRATHVGINRERGVAEDRLLFTQETVQSKDGVSFWARVVADSAYEATLRQVLLREHVIGRGHSRGMGMILVGTGSAKEIHSLPERVELFNEAIKAEIARYDQQSGAGTYFALTLRADAVLTQNDLPVSRPDPKALGLPASTVRVRSWARTTIVGGWHGAARLPYRTRQGVERGTVYLFYSPEGVERQQLYQRLEELERTGIGEWQERGYGQITVCAPFHYRLTGLGQQ